MQFQFPRDHRLPWQLDSGGHIADERNNSAFAHTTNRQFNRGRNPHGFEGPVGANSAGQAQDFLNRGRARINGIRRAQTRRQRQFL